MQLKVIGQSADNNPSLKGVNFQKQPNLKQPPKTIMDKATLIRLTVNCLPNQTPPILLKNASDSLRQVKDNRFKVSDLLFHSAKMKKSSELNNPKSTRTLQSSYYQQQQQQQQSSQSLQKQSQGSFNLATSEDLEIIKLNTCLNYPSTAIHQSQSSRGYLEELQSIKGSLNEYKDKEYHDIKKDKNNNINTINNSKINKSNNKNNTKLQINIKTLNPNDKQAQQSSNYYSLGSCITNQSTDPDEITKQLIKQNLMIFSRRAVLVNNQTSRNVAQHMKSNSNGFGQADTQTSRMEQLQSARGSVRDESSIITNNDPNLGQYQIETSKSLQQSLRNIPVIRTQTQLTACGTLDKMETSQKDNISEKSSEQVTQLSTMSSAVFAGNEEEKNSIILQQDIHAKDMKIKGELKIQKIKLQFQENKRQFIKSSQETKRKFKREEQIISKYEYPIISQENQQKDHEQQIKSQVLDIKRKQQKIILRPQLLSGCSPIRDLSKKRPQTARITYKKLSTVPDKYQDNDGEQNLKTVSQIDKDNNIDQDIFQNVKAHTHRHVRSQSPKEELNMYEQFLCRVLRNERTAVFERIKQNASVMGKQSQGNSQKLLTNVETQKLFQINIENVDKKETRGSLLNNNTDQLSQYLQELKNSQETNRQEQQEQENHGKVCPWQEWNEEIGYDEASLDFIHYANSP